MKKENKNIVTKTTDTLRNVTDDTVKKAAEYRTKKRVPTLSYYFDCKKNGIDSDKIAGIWRSSQSKSGFLGSKNKEDINLINEIKNLGNNFFIYEKSALMKR